MSGIARRYPILAGLIRDLARLARDLDTPAKAGKPAATLIREEGNMLVYKITPAPATAPDVVKQVVTATHEGGPTVLEITPGETGELRVEQGLEVTLTQVDVDDADNTSEPGEPFVFTSADTIAPGAPGAPSVELIAEE